MDTLTLVQSDVKWRIFAHQALSKLKIKGGPGDEANGSEIVKQAGESWVTDAVRATRLVST